MAHIRYTAVQLNLIVLIALGAASLATSKLNKFERQTRGCILLISSTLLEQLQITLSVIS